MKKRTVLFSVVLMATIGIFVVGCATAPSSSAPPSQSDLLKQSGFKFHSDQDEHVAYIQTLPAKKVVLNQYQDKPLYMICTDPDSKTCFIGDQSAYERYQQMAIQNAISEDQRKVQEHRWDPEAWNMWVDSQGGG